MSEFKFLPCMCCGSDRIIHFKTSKNRGYATCIDCGMRTRGCGNYENKDDLKWKDRATILWNTRTPMANIVEKLEERRIEYELSSIKAPDEISSVYRKGVMRGYEYSRDLVKQEINNGLE